MREIIGFSELLNSWLDYCKKRYTIDTYKTYRCAIRQLQRHLAKNGNQFTEQAVEDFLDEKFNKVSRRTFNTYLIIIRSFASWRWKKYKVDSPVHSISLIKADPPKQRVLSEEEYKLCLRNARGVDRDILEFLGNTGLRKSEFANLRWGDISPDIKYIRVIGKGRKLRIVPLNKTCRKVLRRYKRLSAGQGLQISQRYLDNEGASWMCRRLAERIGIPQFGVHALRHYFATELVRKGVDIYTVSRLLGHSSVATTEQIYVHLGLFDLLGITDVLDD